MLQLLLTELRQHSSKCAYETFGWIFSICSCFHEFLLHCQPWCHLKNFLKCNEHILLAVRHQQEETQELCCQEKYEIPVKSKFPRYCKGSRKNVVRACALSIAAAFFCTWESRYQKKAPIWFDVTQWVYLSQISLGNHPGGSSWHSFATKVRQSDLCAAMSDAK